MKTHKIISLFCFLLLITTTTFSQTKGLQISDEIKILGKNYINSSDIVGVELKFPDRIDDYFIDTSTGFLTVQLRGTVNNGRRLNNVGNILQYDLKDAAILWTKTIDYEKCRLLQFDKQLILNDINECYGIDAKTGSSVWGVQDSIFLCAVNLEENMGFAYKFREKKGYTNELLGIDFSKGKQIWSRDINREYDWNDCFYLNDSTLMVVAAGLHTINIRTGKPFIAAFDKQSGVQKYFSLFKNAAFIDYKIIDNEVYRLSFFLRCYYLKFALSPAGGGRGWIFFNSPILS